MAISGSERARDGLDGPEQVAIGFWSSAIWWLLVRESYTLPAGALIVSACTFHGMGLAHLTFFLFLENFSGWLFLGVSGL
jgi:hypothetical protein